MIFKQIKKLNKYLLLLIFFSLCLSIAWFKIMTKNQHIAKAQRQISSVEELINSHIVPAGTPLIVPPWIQQQYLQQMVINQAMFGNNTLLDFLIHNYSVAAPSSTDEDEYTFYVPLLRSSYLDEDDDDDDYFSLTEYFDVTNTSLEKDSDRDEPVFRTIERADTQKNIEQIPESAIRTESISTETTIQQEPSEEPQTQDITEEPSLEDTSPSLEDTSPSLEDTSPKESTEEPIEEPPTEDQPLEESSTLENTPPTLKKSYHSKNCTSSPENETTEAVANCTECSLKEDEIIKGLKAIVTTVDKYKKAKEGGFTAVLKKFCNTCKPVNISDFIKYVKERSKNKNIPPEIFFSLMMQESTGACTALNDSDSDHSVGLLQLNMDSPGSTCLNKCTSDLSQSSSEQLQTACQNGNYRKGNKCKKGTVKDCLDCQDSGKPLICLNNPYCNFEESLDLIGRKWDIGNDTIRRPTELNWLEMNKNERNQWRNTIVAYNSKTYMNKAKRKMEEIGIHNTNDWEQKRVYVIRQNWLPENITIPERIQKEIDEEPDKLEKENIKQEYIKKKKAAMIGNTAYMERVTGREIPCGGENSIIMEWINFIKENPSPDCFDF